MNPDPYHHLALEEALLDLPGDAPPVLHFWRSQPAVVIGKNQIPWREADLGWMQEHGVLLCRRSSGGGAVFHDEGNLNWSVCVSRARYAARLVTECCLEALSAAGVRAQVAGAASLVACGAKISGMAYAYRRDRVLHHGTLLGDADLDMLRRALQPPVAEWETHAVRSEPMHVRNIGGASTTRFQSALVETFRSRFHDGVVLDENPKGAQISDHAPRLRSREWILGRSPKFRLDLRSVEDDQAFHASVIVEHGRIKAESFIQTRSGKHLLPAGNWFGAPCLRHPRLPFPGTCAALGDPANWGDQ